MASRIIIRLELTKEAKAKLRKTGKRFGMTQLSLTDRMARWVEAQSKSVQQAVLSGSEDQAAQIFVEEKERGEAVWGKIQNLKQKIERGGGLCCALGKVGTGGGGFCGGLGGGIGSPARLF